MGNANSFIEISLQVGMFAAGAISGLILHYTGFLTILILNLITFMFAIVLIISIDKDPVPRRTNVKATHHNVQDGFKYLSHNKTIIQIGLLSISPLIVTQLFNVSAPDYVATILHSNSIVYGLSDMSYGIGGLMAGFITSYLVNKITNRKLIIGFFSLASLALLSLYYSNSIVLLYLCNFCLGLSNSSLRVVTNTSLMHAVSQNFMGRITSLWNGLAQFIEIFSSVIIGSYNDQLGANFGFLIMCLIMLIGVIISIIMHDFDN